MKQIRESDEDLYYEVNNYGIEIYKKVAEVTGDGSAGVFPDDPETKKKKETNEKLTEIWEHMIAACDDYIKRFSEAKIKNSNGVLIEYAARAYLEDKAPYDDDIFELAGVDEESEQYLDEDGDPDPDLITEDLLNTGKMCIRDRLYIM